MKIFDDSVLKLAALEYAEKNKIVNQKTIQAYQDAIRAAEKHFTPTYMIDWISKNWDKSEKQIDDEAQMVYYGGNGSFIDKAYKNEKIRLYKERDLAKACKEYLQKIEEK